MIFCRTIFFNTYCAVPFSTHKNILKFILFVERILLYFVGQHECVSIINNYVALDEIEKLLHPKGDDSDEIYSKEFSQALHELIKTHIIHPVWVCNL